MKAQTKQELNMNQLWKAAEAAQYLQLPISTFYLLVQQGKIPRLKLGKHTRFVPEQLIAWAKKQTA